MEKAFLVSSVIARCDVYWASWEELPVRCGEKQSGCISCFSRPRPRRYFA